MLEGDGVNRHAPPTRYRAGADRRRARLRRRRSRAPGRLRRLRPGRGAGRPGEGARAQVKACVRRGRATEILDARSGADRAGADHPGAPWQILPYERQLQVKQEQVDDALRRIGRLSGFELEPIVPAVETWRYRNKVEYSFGSDAGGRSDLRLSCPRALARNRRGQRLPARFPARQRGAGARRGVVPSARIWPPMTVAPAKASSAILSCERDAGRVSSRPAWSPVRASSTARRSPAAHETPTRASSGPRSRAWPRSPMEA